MSRRINDGRTRFGVVGFNFNSSQIWIVRKDYRNGLVILVISSSSTNSCPRINYVTTARGQVIRISWPPYFPRHASTWEVWPGLQLQLFSDLDFRFLEKTGTSGWEDFPDVNLQFVSLNNYVPLQLVSLNVPLQLVSLNNYSEYVPSMRSSGYCGPHMSATHTHIVE